ncbi:MAG: hypothetical protein QE263_02855 [Vampirovibrionales bacterium]|nr:hypothetical protein [Vampirovibrionales bacterium]
MRTPPLQFGSTTVKELKAALEKNDTVSINFEGQGDTFPPRIVDSITIENGQVNMSGPPGQHAKNLEQNYSGFVTVEADGNTILGIDIVG